MKRFAARRLSFLIALALSTMVAVSGGTAFASTYTNTDGSTSPDWNDVDDISESFNVTIGTELEILAIDGDASSDDEGRFTTIAIEPAVGENVLVWEIRWDQVLNDPSNEIRISFDCSDSTGDFDSTDWSGGGTAYPWTSASDGTATVEVSNAAEGVGPGDHCNGQYFYYSVGLTSSSLSSPELAEISLTFGIDDDRDGFVSAGSEMPPYQTVLDPCDGNPAVTEEMPVWYPDCDGDGDAGDFLEISACSAAEALSDTIACSGNDLDDEPYSVSLSPGTDCDDTDDEVSGIHVLGDSDVEDGKDNDCSQDGVGDECFFDGDDDGVGLDGTYVDDADLDSDCDDGADDQNASTDGDCDDGDPTGFMVEPWFPDCDDDDVHSPIGVSACGIDGANASFDCDGGGDPPGFGADQWVTKPGTDCDDLDPNVQDSCNVFRDGFESGDSTNWN